MNGSPVIHNCDNFYIENVNIVKKIERWTDMKRIATASELFKEDDYEIIFIPESLCEEIDEIIKQTKSHHDRDDFVSSAIDKFISDGSEEKIQTTKHVLKD